MGSMTGQRLGRVAIIGGGIAGMASAHFLANAGAQVTLYEASDQWGGLGTFFRCGETHFERFYHCILPSDQDLLKMLERLGIEDRVYWRKAEFGFLSQGKLYGLNTPIELLSFALLPMVDRIRIGFTALYASLVSSDGLDDVTAETWLTRLCGRRAFDRFWKPLLQAKFGSGYNEVPALWFWTRFRREKGTRKEVKGYIRGGYRFLTEKLTTELRESGVELYLNSPVESLDLGESCRPVVNVRGQFKTFDRVVMTTPLFFLKTLAGNGRMNDWMGGIAPDLDTQGVVNVVLLLRRGLTPYYWVAAIDEDVPFQGIVESSVLLEPEDTGGHHLVYLMQYVHRTDPLFARSDDDIINEYVVSLKKLFPDLLESDFVDRYVFRAPFVEPLYTTGYLKQKPPSELVPGRVYLATTSQVYPGITSWNGSVGLAKSVVAELVKAVNLGRHEALPQLRIPIAKAVSR